MKLKFSHTLSTVLIYMLKHNCTHAHMPTYTCTQAHTHMYKYTHTDTQLNTSMHTTDETLLLQYINILQYLLLQHNTVKKYIAHCSLIIVINL